jgi:hypothetical protein
MPLAFFSIVPPLAALPALVPLSSLPPAALAAGAANPKLRAKTPQTSVKARREDGKEAVMMGSFRWRESPGNV